MKQKLSRRLRIARWIVRTYPARIKDPAYQPHNKAVMRRHLKESVALLVYHKLKG